MRRRRSVSSTHSPVLCRNEKDELNNRLSKLTEVGGVEVHVWCYSWYMCGDTLGTCVVIQLVHVWCGDTAGTCVVGDTASTCMVIQLIHVWCYS